jgi:ribosomal-protein-alanine N-acetyltransferase
VKIVLETARLVLRETGPDDAEAMFALNSDPEVVRYTGDGPFPSVDAARSFFTNYREVYARTGMGRWAVVVKPGAGVPAEDAGANIGFCGLKREDDGDVDLGYRLLRRTWGKGYATEAARATLAWGFDVQRLTRIIGRAHVDNARSNHVLEKLGMTRVGPTDIEGAPAVLYEIAATAGA